MQNQLYNDKAKIMAYFSHVSDNWHVDVVNLIIESTIKLWDFKNLRRCFAISRPFFNLGEFID